MNSFLLNLASFKKVSTPLFSAINPSTILPSMECVLIEKNEDCIDFTTTDLESFVKVKIKPEFAQGDFRFCLHKKVLSQFVLNPISELVDCKFAHEHLHMKMGEFSLKKETIQWENFPKYPDIGEFSEIVVDAKDLYPLFLNAIRFVSTDNMRPSMTGVWIGRKEKELYIASTDAHKLYFKSIMPIPSELKTASFIIPKKGISLFLKSFKIGALKIRFSKTHIEFSQEGMTLVIRLIDARYPNWESVLPQNDILFYMQRKALASFLNIAAPFVNTSTNRIDFTINTTGITVSGGDAEFGDDIKYRMPIHNQNKDFPPFRFAINLKFLREIVSLTKDEYCKIEHSGLHDKAIIIDDSFLLMPLMLNDAD